MATGDYSAFAKIDKDEKLDWLEKANCIGSDTESFFIEKGEYYTVELRRICQGCTVQSECLEYSVRYRTVGYWAGTTEQQRRLMTVTEKKASSASRPR